MQTVSNILFVRIFIIKKKWLIGRYIFFFHINESILINCKIFIIIKIRLIWFTRQKKNISFAKEFACSTEPFLIFDKVETIQRISIFKKFVKSCELFFVIGIIHYITQPHTHSEIHRVSGNVYGYVSYYYFKFALTRSLSRSRNRYLCIYICAYIYIFMYRIHQNHSMIF